MEERTVVKKHPSATARLAFVLSVIALVLSIMAYNRLHLKLFLHLIFLFFNLRFNEITLFLCFKFYYSHFLFKFFYLFLF